MSESRLRLLLGDANKDRHELRREVEDTLKANHKLGEIIRKAAMAVGKPTTGGGSSWHDLDQWIARLVKERDGLRKAVEIWGDASSEPDCRACSLMVSSLPPVSPPV